MKKITLAVVMTALFLRPLCSYAQEHTATLCGTATPTFTEEEQQAANEYLAHLQNTAFIASDKPIPINFTIIRKETYEEDRYAVTPKLISDAVATLTPNFPFQEGFVLGKIKYVINAQFAELPDATDPCAGLFKDKALYDKYAFKNQGIEVFIVTTNRSYAWLPNWIPAICGSQQSLNYKKNQTLFLIIIS
jgi:hypothetical protein